MERETRIELATNSLEGCDSTIELLPLLISIIPLRAFTAVRTGRFRFRLRSQSRSPGTWKRYPTLNSVNRYRGLPGSFSIFLRIWLTKTWR